MSNLNAPETIALAKAIPKKHTDACREELTEGTYSVDFTVRVTGSLDVGQDYERTPTVSLSPIMLAALAIRGRGATDAAFKAKLGDLMRAAVECHNNTTMSVPTCLTKEASEAKDEIDALVKYVKGALGGVKKELAKLPKAKCNGPVKASLVVAVVEEKRNTGKLRKATLGDPPQQELV